MISSTRPFPTLSILAASIILGIGLQAGTASAAFLTVSATIPDGSASGGLFFPAQFDPALGTLTDITFRLSGDRSTQTRHINDGTGPEAGQVFQYANFRVTILSGFVMQTSGVIGDESFLVPFPGEHLTNMNNSFSESFAPPISSPELVPYQGTGTISLGWQRPLEGADDSNPLTIDVLHSSEYSNIRLDVIYEYTAVVPEPSTWALAVLGLVGLAMLAARRHRN